MEAKERAGNITEADKTAFIISIKELVDKDAISPQEAFKLFEHVENGRIPVSQAYKRVQDLLTIHL